MSQSDERARDRLLAQSQEWRRRASQTEELDQKLARLSDDLSNQTAISAELRRKTTELRRKTTELRRKTTELRRKTTELRRETTELRRETAELRRETAELRRERLALIADRDSVSKKLMTAARDRQTLHTDIQDLESKVSALDRSSRATKKQLAQARQQRDIYRGRLQQQYDLRWTRLGSALRDVRTRPIRILKLPFALAQALRPSKRDVSGLQADTSPDSTHGDISPRSAPPISNDSKPAVVSRDQRAVVAIFDQFTNACMAPELRLIPAQREDRPQHVAGAELLFTETAWRGNDGQWSYMFNKYEPDNDLDRLLTATKSARIPTAIWNKEDPVNYDLFLPVVKRFDYVFTTDQAAVPRYRTDLGHDRVAPMMFAAQPAIHNPIGRPTGSLSTVCFAGAWRGHKYPGRADRLNALLDAANGHGELVIFDREPNADSADEGFPARFHPNIRAALSYPDMVDAYRQHSCFLNINTVEESPTMMSRRVFEILACRTPVISTPSAAIATHLPDVVLTPITVEDIGSTIDLLVHDADYRDRLGQLGYRKVMSRHTYQHRVADAFRFMNLDGFPDPSEPSIDVICVSSRPEYFDRALDNVRRQIAENTRLIFVTNSSAFDQEHVNRRVAEFPDAVAIHLPEELTLGECLNAAIDHGRSEFYAKFDDDDHYGANYLSDMVLATRFADASVYGKRSFHAHVEATDQTVVRHEGHEFKFTNLVMGGTLLVRRRDVSNIHFEAVPAGTDTRFLRTCSAADLRIFSTDRFNYLMVRRASTEHHTWKIEDSDFMSSSRVVGDGLRSDLVLI